MSEFKYCQGPICHEHKTKDRIRGPKGDKHYETRKRSRFYYGANFRSLMCQDDWFREYGNRAVDHFGRIHEPIRLTEERAWEKYHDWSNSAYYFRNGLTFERIPLTMAQYDDNDYTLERARQT